MRWTALYLLSIVLVNVAFEQVPLVATPIGAWPPASLLVGLVFVTRDFAQREVGHRVLLAMLLGCIISYVVADPFIAVASVAAFAIGELVDWGVYTITKRPFHDRLLLSSAISTPVDTAVFLGLVGILSPAAFALMAASKMAGALLVYLMVRRRFLAAHTLSLKAGR